MLNDIWNEHKIWQELCLFCKYSVIGEWPTSQKSIRQIWYFASSIFFCLSVIFFFHFHFQFYMSVHTFSSHSHPLHCRIWTCRIYIYICVALWRIESVFINVCFVLHLVCWNFLWKLSSALTCWAAFGSVEKIQIVQSWIFTDKILS